MAKSLKHRQVNVTLVLLIIRSTMPEFETYSFSSNDNIMLASKQNEANIHLTAIGIAPIPLFHVSGIFCTTNGIWYMDNLYNPGGDWNEVLLLSFPVISMLLLAWISLRCWYNVASSGQSIQFSFQEILNEVQIVPSKQFAIPAETRIDPFCFGATTRLLVQVTRFDHFQCSYWKTRCRPLLYLYSWFGPSLTISLGISQTSSYMFSTWHFCIIHRTSQASPTKSNYGINNTKLAFWAGNAL